MGVRAVIRRDTHSLCTLALSMRWESSTDLKLSLVFMALISMGFREIAALSRWKSDH